MNPQDIINDPAPGTQPDRRKFFKIFGSGLAVAILCQDMSLFATSGDALEMIVPTNQVGAWIHIGPSGLVQVFTGKVEVGQNIRTSLSQVVAEELGVPMATVSMVMADTDLVPFDMGTFGSRSTPQMGNQLRRASATAKQALLDMAATKWNKKAADLSTADGCVIDRGTGNRIGYGALTNGQQLLINIAEHPTVVAPQHWTITGKAVPKVNGRSFINGSHNYVSDMKLPGMLYGKMLRPPSYGATLENVDLSQAKAIKDVIVHHDGDFVGVAAPDRETATRALGVIKASWAEIKHASRATLFDYLTDNSRAPGSRGNTSSGDIKAGFATADIKHDSTCLIHYIAHVPLEPRAALAEWKEGRLTVWTGTQRPFGVRDDLAEMFKLPKEQVRVVTPDTGSGYGGKHSGEAAAEAAKLAQVAKKPVKIMWTRKEEFTWAYFRPAGVIKVSSGVTRDGKIKAWKFDNYNSGPSGLDIQYRTGSQQIAHHPSNSPLPQGSYRGLASTANVFAREAHVADLARMTGIDQLTFRMDNLEDPRLKAVLTAAADKFGWSARAKLKGHGYGLACGFEKGGYVATCTALIVQPDKTVKILRVVQAFECGAIVNPRHLQSQVSGSIVQGLGGALFEAIDFADGRILNPTLSTYRVPRFKDVPHIEIVLLDRKDLPSSGAGEAAIIGIAPSIRNAILDATGIAINQLPLLPNGTVA